MKKIVPLLSAVLLLNPGCFKKPVPYVKAPDTYYCNKLDSLVNNRNDPKYWSIQDFELRIVSELRDASGIYGTYKFGMGGLIYCDTFFNNDVRRWSKCFGCNIALRPAPAEITPFCDTTPIISDMY